MTNFHLLEVVGCVAKHNSMWMKTIFLFIIFLSHFKSEICCLLLACCIHYIFY